MAVPVSHSPPGSLLRAKPAELPGSSGSPPSFIHSSRSEHPYTRPPAPRDPLSCEPEPSKSPRAPLAPARSQPHRSDRRRPPAGSSLAALGRSATHATKTTFPQRARADHGSVRARGEMPRQPERERSGGSTRLSGAGNRTDRAAPQAAAREKWHVGEELESGTLIVFIFTQGGMHQENGNLYINSELGAF